MKRHVFLFIAGIVQVIFGAMFLFFTADAIAPLVNGIIMEPALLTVAKNVGVFMIAIGLINFLGRNSRDYIALSAILLGSLFCLVVTTGTDTYWTIKGVFTSQAWGSIGIRIIFILG